MLLLLAKHARLQALVVTCCTSKHQLDSRSTQRIESSAIHHAHEPIIDWDGLSITRSMVSGTYLYHAKVLSILIGWNNLI